MNIWNISLGVANPDVYIINIVHLCSRRRVNVLTWEVPYMHVWKEMGEETDLLRDRMLIIEEVEFAMVNKSEGIQRTET